MKWGLFVVTPSWPVVVEASEHLRRRRLVEARVLRQTRGADGFQQVQDTLGSDVRGELWVAEGVAHDSPR